MCTGYWVLCTGHVIAPLNTLITNYAAFRDIIFPIFSPKRVKCSKLSSGNVVWTDVHSVKRALLNMSAPFTGEELEKRKEELKERERTGEQRVFYYHLSSSIFKE